MKWNWYKPFDSDAAEGALASGSTISRFERAVSGKDIYRPSEALVDQFIAGYATPPEALVLDIDHSEDAAYLYCVKLASVWNCSRGSGADAARARWRRDSAASGWSRERGAAFVRPPRGW